jgi:cysteine desulfurase
VIYLDHNATTPLHPLAFEAMVPFLRERWGNPSSPYRFGAQARLAVEAGAQRVADLFRLHPRGDRLLLRRNRGRQPGAPGRGAGARSKGNHVVTTSIEHHAVLNTCRALEKEGCRVTYLPVTEEGVVEMAALAGSLRDDTILVTVMHANNETGVVQPVEEIAAITRRRGIVFHTDAVQSAGKLPRRIARLGADLVTFSGHKLYGPKGAAALYVRAGTPLSGAPEPSHVLRAMGLSPLEAQGSIRLSLGRETRPEDVDTTAGVLAATVARLRRVSSTRGAAQ